MRIKKNWLITTKIKVMQWVCGSVNDERKIFKNLHKKKKHEKKSISGKKNQHREREKYKKGSLQKWP